MTTDRFPWYDIVEGDELEQGDVIPGCPCYRPMSAAEPGKRVTFNWEERDVKVLSQSCDLVSGREKLSEVLLASVWKPSDLTGHLATPKGLEDARRGILPSVHLLAECHFDWVEPGIRDVDFRSLVTMPLAFLRDQAMASAKRLRLLPPYREHLSQAFARFTMRVGLPVDIPPFR